MLPPSKVQAGPQPTASPSPGAVVAKAEQDTTKSSSVARQKDAGNEPPATPAASPSQPAESRAKKIARSNRGGASSGRASQRGAATGRNSERGTANQRALDRAHNDAILAGAADGSAGSVEGRIEVRITESFLTDQSNVVVSVNNILHD